MKKSIIIVFIFITSFSFAQFNSEFDYFTLKLGAVHGLLDAQPDYYANKMIERNGNQYQLFPDSNFFGYTPGFYGTFLFNHDLQNDNVGLSVGFEYKMYGISAKYSTFNELYTLVESHYVSQVSVPFYIKYGKKFYEPQKYFYLGGTFNYNLSLMKTEKVNFTENAKKIKLTTDMLSKSNFAVILGFNYMFFNLQADYVIGNFLSRNYEETYSDGSTGRPFEVQPRNYLIIRTGFTFPINSWTSRKWYMIETQIRRLLK